MSDTVSVLVVDDSHLIRTLLTRGLSRMPGIEVVGTARDAYEARDKIVELNPDVMTLDIEMPKVRGIDFLKRLIPQHPMPVVMVSAHTAPGASTTLEALEHGAVDFVLKPSGGGAQLDEMIDTLAGKIRTAARAKVRAWANGSEKLAPRSGTPFKAGSNRIIAIGASTGGTVALRHMITEFPADMPGTVVVQHMPPVFTRMFAERLNDLSAVVVKEAEDGDRILGGRVLIAPGDKHLEVVKCRDGYSVVCKAGAKVNGHCPSVDVLFRSVAKHVGSKAVGVMLTGMGRDGALAMLEMRKTGARTYSQDEQSCAVYGMPKEAWECGAAERQVNIDDMTQVVAAAVGTLR